MIAIGKAHSLFDKKVPNLFGRPDKIYCMFAGQATPHKHANRGESKALSSLR